MVLERNKRLLAESAKLLVAALRSTERGRITKGGAAVLQGALLHLEAIEAQERTGLVIPWGARTSTVAVLVRAGVL